LAGVFRVCLRERCKGDADRGPGFVFKGRIHRRTRGSHRSGRGAGHIGTWSRVPETLKPRLTTLEVDFAEMQVPDCDLVNASFALPFCKPAHFPALWSRIVAGIRPGGRFAGQFFGDRDTWASLPGRTHHSREEVIMLLDGFEIEMMTEEERDDPPELRSPKHWQMFHVVAKKR